MIINSLYQLSGRYFLTWNCVPVKGLKITVRMRHCSDKNVNFSCLSCWGWYSDKQTNTVYPAYTGLRDGRSRVGCERLSTSSCAGKQVRIEECANEGSRFPSWLKPSRTINCLPKISAPTLGRQATVPAVPPLLLMRALVQAHIPTRVPVSALSVYDELKNLRLLFGSSGISSLFLNHWYWDLGKPSSSTQFSSADFPKGTDFGTLHFGTTGFTAAIQNISVLIGSKLYTSHEHRSDIHRSMFLMLLCLELTLMVKKKQKNTQCHPGSLEWEDGYMNFGARKHHQNMQRLLSLALQFRADAVSEVSSYSPEHAFAAGQVWS